MENDLRVKSTINHREQIYSTYIVCQLLFSWLKQNDMVLMTDSDLQSQTASINLLSRASLFHLRRVARLNKNARKGQSRTMYCTPRIDFQPYDYMRDIPSYTISPWNTKLLITTLTSKSDSLKPFPYRGFYYYLQNSLGLKLTTYSNFQTSKINP